MADQYERLRRLHLNLLGTHPQEAQDRLYKAFPAALGYATPVADDVLFEAALMLALLQAGKVDGEKEVHKVYFLTPASFAEGWVLTEFRAAAKRIFDRLKTGKSVTAVKHVGELFHQVMLGSQVFTLPQEPDRWVAFGFSRSAPIPDWMSRKLLDVNPEVPRNLSPGV